MSVRNELALLTRSDIEHEATIRKAVDYIDKLNKVVEAYDDFLEEITHFGYVAGSEGKPHTYRINTVGFDIELIELRKLAELND